MFVSNFNSSENSSNRMSDTNYTTSKLGYERNEEGDDIELITLTYGNT